MHDMDLIDTQELKAKLDRGDGFKVVMTLGEWEYRTTHIPGSIRVSTVEEALEEEGRSGVPEPVGVPAEARGVADFPAGGPLIGSWCRLQ